MSRGRRKANGEYRPSHERRKKLDLGASARKKQLDRVYQRDNATCCICGQWVDRKDASREHVIALKDGGSNQDHNIALAHRKCNNENH